jgi:hypothetical protein
MLNPAVLSLDPPTIVWGVFPVQSLPEEVSQANPGVVALPPTRTSSLCRTHGSGAPNAMF